MSCLLGVFVTQCITSGKLVFLCPASIYILSLLVNLSDFDVETSFYNHYLLIKMHIILTTGYLSNHYSTISWKLKCCASVVQIGAMKLGIDRKAFFLPTSQKVPCINPKKPLSKTPIQKMLAPTPKPQTHRSVVFHTLAFCSWHSERIPKKLSE